MSVKLRQRSVCKGTKISFYLDIYHNQDRWTETIKNIQINKHNQTPEDKEKKLLAQQIKVKRENELIVECHDLPNITLKKIDFIEWFRKFAASKKEVCPNYYYCHKYAEKYANGKRVPFQAITVDWLRGFSALLLENLKQNSARAYFICLYIALEEAEKQDLVRKNPMKYLDKGQDYIKEEDVERAAYNIDEIATLSNTSCTLRSKYNHCTEQYRDAYLFSCFSGLRWSDVNQLKWDEISYQVFDRKREYYVKVKQTKTQKEVLIPLGESALSIIQKRESQSIHEPQSPYVFPLVKETHPGQNRVYFRVRLYIKKWAKESGFDPKKMHFHNSRHTFATNLINYAKPDIKTVSKLLGHKSIRSTEKYAQIRNETQVAAVKAIPKINFKQRPAA